METQELIDGYFKKIKILNDVLWGGDIKKSVVDGWLSNFKLEKERLHALHILSKFMYFNGKLIREMLKAMYRDLYK